MNRTEDNDAADRLLETLRHIDNAKHICIGYEDDGSVPAKKNIWRRA